MFGGCSIAKPSLGRPKDGASDNNNNNNNSFVVLLSPFHNYSTICKTFSLKMSNSTLTSVDWPNQLVNGLWVSMSQKGVSLFCPDVNVGYIFPVITKWFITKFKLCIPGKEN